MQDRRLWKPGGAPRGATPCPGALVAQPGGWPHPLAAWARGATPQGALPPILSPRSESPREQPRYAISSTIPLSKRF